MDKKGKLHFHTMTFKSSTTTTTTEHTRRWKTDADRHIFVIAVQNDHVIFFVLRDVFQENKPERKEMKQRCRLSNGRNIYFLPEMIFLVLSCRQVDEGDT